MELKEERKFAEYDFIDFDIIEEPWNLYKLEDQSILKTRFVLINVLKEKGTPKGTLEFGFQSTNVLGVIPPPELIGVPSRPYGPEELESSVVAEDLKIDRIGEERWNKYKLKNEIELNVKNVLVTVSRTNKFDQRGLPVYLVNLQAIVKPKIPKELREKIKKGLVE